MNDLAVSFAPDWVSPPGDTILDLIEEKEWTQDELATRLGVSAKLVNQLIKGKAALSQDTALKLERVLGSTAAFWISREALYREQLSRAESKAKLGQWTSWLDCLPLKELMSSGAIEKCRIVEKNKPGLVEQCLKFFGVASPDEWTDHYSGMQVAFRRSREDQSDIAAISSWLRMGEIEAEQFSGPKYDRDKFEKALIEIRSLTTKTPKDFEPRMRSLFTDAGVAFVLVPAIPRSHVSGVARWLNPHRPLIQMSLYGKTNDKFWFTLFHESAHILLHANEKKSVYLDDPSKRNNEDPKEIEANDWAGNFMIPKQYSHALAGLKTRDAVQTFARQIGVHPGIVVGRLQHDGLIEVSWMNDLKQSFRFAETN